MLIISAADTPSDKPPANDAPEPINWKHNLAFIWFSQFLSLAGFGFAMPFAQYYIQELGVTNEADMLRWTSYFIASAPLSLAIMSPVWGMLGDRYGRRMMLLRANIGAAIALTLMGNVRFAPALTGGMLTALQALIILRLFQGIFTGTVPAAMTLVSTTTPAHRQGLAIGTLSTAIVSGIGFGKIAGAGIASALGYDTSFMVGGGMLMLASGVIFFGVQERFTHPLPIPSRPGELPRKRRFRLPPIGPILPLLVLISATALTRQFDMVTMPRFIKLLSPDLYLNPLTRPLIAWLTSLTNSPPRIEALGMGIMSVVETGGAILAGLLIGRLVDRQGMTRKVGIFCALGSALMVFGITCATNFGALLPLRFGLFFFAGGLGPVLQVWLGRATTAEIRGSAFGWSVSARALGWIGASSLSTQIAIAAAPLRKYFFAGHLKATFFCQATFFVLLVPLIIFTFRRMTVSSKPKPTENQAH